MLISVYAFYLGVLKNNGYHCHVLYIKVLVKENKNSTAGRRTSKTIRTRLGGLYK